MKATVIAATQPTIQGTAVDVVEQAACICYDSNPTQRHIIARACARSGHMSVWEHISFTFRIEQVSRSLLAQLTRHRHFSFSVRSQRYCDARQDGYIRPIGLGPEADTVLREGCLAAFNKYTQLREMGIAAEDARAVLPNAASTELVLTANARALVEASRLRLCSRAQGEIRELFREMRRAVAPYAPEVADMMRPQCEANQKHPFCPEERSCGRHPRLADVYAVVEGEDL